MAAAAAGAALLAHATYGYLTFEPTGPPCHFCAVDPGLALPLLELGVGVPVAALAVALASGPRFDPAVEVSPLPRALLGVGGGLALVGGGFTAITGGYGIVYGGPLALLGLLLLACGACACGVEVVTGGRE